MLGMDYSLDCFDRLRSALDALDTEELDSMSKEEIQAIEQLIKVVSFSATMTPDARGKHIQAAWIPVAAIFSKLSLGSEIETLVNSIIAFDISR